MKKIFTFSLWLFVFSTSVKAQTISTFAGSTQGYATGAGVSAQFNRPYGIAFDGGGAVVLTDQSNYRVRKIYSDQSTGLLAGSSTTGNVNGTGANAQFGTLAGVARDGFNNTYVTDANYNVIKKITSSGVVTTIAGDGTPGYADAAGNGATAQFYHPYGIASDINGNLYVADTYNHKIRKITTLGVVTTLAGSTQGYADGTGSNAQLSFPMGIAIDASGNIFVGENCRIRKITPTGVVTTFAGGTPGYLDGNGTSARFNNGINGIAIDASGNLFVTDTYNYRIRKITPAGDVTTYAGLGYSGTTDGDVSVATFSEITGIAVGNTGIVYIVDNGNHRVRRITPPVPPTVPAISGISVSSLTASSATISYYLNANNGATTSVIKYGLASNNLSSQVSGFSTTGNSPNIGTTTISGLQENTTYYYQIEATNSAGTTTTAPNILSFTTTIAPVQQLIAQYNFDNSYNNINGNAPFVQNASTSFTTDRHGNINRALNINSISTNMGTTATIANLPYGNSARTIAFWAKVNTLRADYNMTFSYGQLAYNSGNGGSFKPNGVTYFGYNNNFDAPATNAINTWYFFTYTYDGTTAKIYKNGILIGSEAKAWNTLNNSDVFRLGIGIGGEFWFDGTIDDLKIYNYALSDASITGLYNTNTLPVNLISFTAKSQNNSTILNWETSSETNNSHFIIKRSEDGVNFNIVSKVSAKSGNGAKYQFIDRTPLNGTNYYQLLQVDLDGKTTDLGIKTISFSIKDAVRVSPNPTANLTNIHFNAGIYQQAKLVDINGKLLQQFMISKIQQAISFSLETYPKGMYFIKLTGSKENSTQKIIKQ